MRISRSNAYHLVPRVTLSSVLASIASLLLIGLFSALIISTVTLPRELSNLNMNGIKV